MPRNRNQGAEGEVRSSRLSPVWQRRASDFRKRFVNLARIWSIDSARFDCSGCVITQRADTPTLGEIGWLEVATARKRERVVP